MNRDFPDFLFDFWDGPQEPVRQCLEGAKSPKACTGCLLPKNISQIHYTLTALEHFDLQTVQELQYVETLSVEAISSDILHSIVLILPQEWMLTCMSKRLTAPHI